MADSSGTNYSVTIEYNTNKDHGSNSLYGGATVNNGVTTSNTSVTGTYGTQIEAKVSRKADGFKFKGWYNSIQSNIVSTSETYTFPLSRTTTLYPAFEPQNVSFNNTVILIVQGDNPHPDITIESMLGYYLKTKTSPTTGITYTDFPDGKQLSLKIKNQYGYSYTYTYTNTEVTPRGASGQTSGDSGEGGGDSQEYSTFTIPHPNNYNTTITITYTQNLPTYSVKVVPNGQGNVDVSVTSNSTPAIEEGEQTRGTVNTRGASDSGGGSSHTTKTINVTQGTRVQLSATPDAGYVFSGWTSDKGSEQAASTYTYTVNQSEVWTAKFVPEFPFIAAGVSPSGTGTVKLYNATTGAEVSNPVYKSSRITQVRLEATPASGYEFLYWEVDGSEYSSQSTITVGFGEYDTTYTAVFAEVGSANVNIYTSSIVSGRYLLQSGANDEALGVTYTDYNGIEQKVTTGSTLVTINPVIEEDDGGHFIRLRFDYIQSYVSETQEGRYRQRYTYNSIKYASGFITADGNWTNAQLTSDGTWKFYLTSYTPGRTPVYTVSAFYDRVNLCTLNLDIYTNNPYSSTILTDIVLSGSGDFAQNSNVTVKYELRPGVNQNKYVFDGWYSGSDKLSGTSPYTFTLTGDKDVVAVFSEKCQLTYSANPSSRGTLECIDVETGNAVNSGTWIPIDTKLQFTCTPTGAAQISRWSLNDGNIPGVGQDTTILLNATEDPFDVKVYLVESSKILNVTISGGGTVTVEEITPDGNVVIDPDSNGNYLIGDNNGFRATAVPGSRYKFSEYVITDSTGSSTSSQPVLTINPMQRNTDLLVVFEHISWVNTLGTIIKIF